MTHCSGLKPLLRALRGRAPSGLLLAPLALAAALVAAVPGSARAMELDGKIDHPWSVEVRNPYAGTCVEVRTRIGEAVEAGDILAVYRLDQKDHDEIEQGLGERDLRLRQGELRLLEAQWREASAKRDKLRDAVEAGVESRARLAASQSSLDLLEGQIEVLRADLQDIALRLREDRARISERLGRAPLSGQSAPWEAYLLAPMSGVVSDQKIVPRAEMPKDKFCFSVTRATYHVLCQVDVTDYMKLKAGAVGKATIQGFPGQDFEAVLQPLPLIAADKGINADASYEVIFLIRGLDQFVSEGVRAKITLGQ